LVNFLQLKDVITLAITDWIAIDNYKIERFLRLRSIWRYKCFMWRLNVKEIFFFFLLITYLFIIQLI